MHANEIKILELRHRAYKNKKRVKIALFFLIFALCAGFCVYAYMQVLKEKELKTTAKAQKIQTQERLEKAKLDYEKEKLKNEKLKQELIYQAEDTQTQSKILINTTSISTQKLKKQFKNKPDLRTALMLAEFYHENKNYKEAISWALKANELDKRAWEAWRIFIEANLALGDKDKALKAYKNYNDFYTSEPLPALK